MRRLLPLLAVVLALALSASASALTYIVKSPQGIVTTPETSILITASEPVACKQYSETAWLANGSVQTNSAAVANPGSPYSTTAVSEQKAGLQNNATYQFVYHCFNQNASKSATAVKFSTKFNAQPEPPKTEKELIQVTCNSNSKLGDVNNDGKVTVTDAWIVGRAFLGFVNFTGNDQRCADVAPVVNNASQPDGKITAGDATVVQRIALGQLPDMGTVGNLNKAPTWSSLGERTFNKGSGMQQDVLNLLNFANDDKTAKSALTFMIVSQSNTNVADCSIDSSKKLDCNIKTVVGSSNVVLRVYDENSAYADATFKVNVVEGNAAPTLSGLPDFTFNASTGMHQGIIDLFSFASDDKDTDDQLAFAIVRETNTNAADCSIRNDRLVDCDVKDATTFTDVNITATDSGGLKASDIFRVTVVAAPVKKAPVVTSVLPQGSTVSQSSAVQISAGVTDDGTIVSVKAEVTQPSGSKSNLTLTDPDNDKRYTGSYTLTSQLGSYNFKIIAKDNDSLVNDTQPGSFTVVDNTGPSISSVRPISGTQFLAGSSVVINATVTDNSGVASVTARVTNTTSQQTTLTMNNIGGNVYAATYTSTSGVGNYTVLITATDAAGNPSTSNTRFKTFVLDSTPPNVTVVLPVAGSVFAQNYIVNISANVVDDFTIDRVSANITKPDATVTVLQLSNASSSLYSELFTDTIQKGAYTVRIIANDTSGNVNDTETTTFVIDNIVPAVTNLTPTAGQNIEVGSTLGIAANVNDNVAVETVLANITLPDTTIQTIQLFDADLDTNYTGTFANTTQIGTYTVTFIANDTSDNINNTQTTFFVGNDVAAPNVTNLTPTAGQNFEVGSIVDVAANVNDNVAVDKVFADVTLPDLSVQTIQLFDADLDTNFTGTFANTSQLGTYNVLFIANDTSGNVNETQTTFFVTQDTIPPTVTNLTPLNASSFGQNTIVDIAANVFDNVAVDVVGITIFLPDGSVQSFFLTDPDLDGNYTGTFDNTTLVGRYNVSFVANDTSSNVNDTEVTSFNINDTTNPGVINVTPPGFSTFPVGTVVDISANVFDDVAVDTVLANITSVGDIQTIELFDLDLDGNYTGTFANTSQPGTYTILFIANDTSNNINDSITTFFTAIDSIPPAFENITESPSDPATYDPVGSYTFTIDVTDNVAVDTVTIDFDGTNFTAAFVNGNTYSFTTGPLTAAVHAYNWFMNDTPIGNINSTGPQTYTVLQATPTCTLDLTPASPITYGTFTTANGSCTNTDGTAVEKLFRNTVDVTAAENGTAILLPAGNHDYEYNVTATMNYTEATTGIIPYTVNKRAAEVNISIDGTINQNVTITLPTAATVSAATNSSNVSLFRDAVEIANPDSTALPAGLYNFTAYANESENLTANSITVFLEVLDIPSEFINSFWNSTGPLTGNISSIKQVFNSTIYDSNILDDTSNVNSSRVVANSIINDSFVLATSDINLSTINGSIITDCDVFNSTLEATDASNCIVESSTIDPAATLRNSIDSSTVRGSRGSNVNLSNSNLTNSTAFDSQVFNSSILQSNLANTTAQNSTLTNVNATNSTVTNTQLSNAELLNAVVVDNMIQSGNITQNGVTYDATANGPANTSDVANQPPVAVLEQDKATAGTGEDIQFNASKSSDPNIGGPLNDSITFLWDFGDSTTSTLAEPVKSYTNSGNFTITLTVTDRFGAADVETSSVVITSGSPPSAGGSAGGGGGGGGGGGIAARTLPYSKDFRAKENVSLMIEGKRYTMTVDNVAEDSATFSVGTTAKIVSIGQTVKADVDNDNVLELAVTASVASNPKNIKLSFAEIQEQVQQPLAVELPPAKTVEEKKEEQKSEKEAVAEEKQSEQVTVTQTLQKQPAAAKAIVTVLIITGLAGVGFGGYFLVKWAVKWL